MNSKYIVYIVDDDKDFSESLLWLIQPLGYDVKLFSSSETFLDASIDNNKSNCLLLDVRMQGMTGLELQQELKQKNYNIPIIFISAHGDVPMCARAMKEGAVDFLTKPINTQILLEAINKAIRLDETAKLRNNERQILAQYINTLTAREKEVMRLMAEGIVTKKIAAILNIETSTAEVYRSKVMKKLKVNSASELVKLVLNYQLL